MGMFNVGIIYNIQKRYRYYTMQTLYKKNGSIDERIFLFFFHFVYGGFCGIL